MEQLVVDAKAKISLAGTIMNEKRRDACCALNAQAETGKIERQNFQGLYGGCAAISINIDDNFESVPVQSNRSLRVVVDQPTNDGREFLRYSAESQALLIAESRKPLPFLGQLVIKAPQPLSHFISLGR